MILAWLCCFKALNLKIQISNDLEVVSRYNDTQLQVGEN